MHTGRVDFGRDALGRIWSAVHHVFPEDQALRDLYASALARLGGAGRVELRRWAGRQSTLSDKLRQLLLESPGETAMTSNDGAGVKS